MEALYQEPTLISGLVGMGIDRIAITGAWEALNALNALNAQLLSVDA